MFFVSGSKKQLLEQFNNTLSEDVAFFQNRTQIKLQRRLPFLLMNMYEYTELMLRKIAGAIQLVL